MVVQRCDDSEKGVSLLQLVKRRKKFLIAFLLGVLILYCTVRGALADDFSVDGENSITVVDGKTEFNVYTFEVKNLRNDSYDVVFYSKSNAMNPLSKQWVSFENGKKSESVVLKPREVFSQEFYVSIPSGVALNSYIGQIDVVSDNQSFSYVFTIDYVAGGMNFWDKFFLYGSIGLVVVLFLFWLRKTFS